MWCLISTKSTTLTLFLHMLYHIHLHLLHLMLIPLLVFKQQIDSMEIWRCLISYKSMPPSLTYVGSYIKSTNLFSVYTCTLFLSIQLLLLVFQLQVGKTYFSVCIIPFQDLYRFIVVLKQWWSWNPAIHLCSSSDLKAMLSVQLHWAPGA